MQNRQFTVTLPTEIAEKVEAKVRSGQYANESDVLCDGVLALEDRDEAIVDDALEEWLRREVVPALKAVEADPASAVPIAEVRRGLKAKYEAATRSRRK